MQIPLWAFITACFIFLVILIHQEVRLSRLLKGFWDTDFVLRQYVKKFGKVKFPNIDYILEDDLENE